MRDFFWRPPNARELFTSTRTFALQGINLCINSIISLQGNKWLSEKSRLCLLSRKRHNNTHITNYSFLDTRFFLQRVTRLLIVVCICVRVRRVKFPFSFLFSFLRTCRDMDFFFSRISRNKIDEQLPARRVVAWWPGATPRPENDEQ